MSLIFPFSFLLIERSVFFDDADVFLSPAGKIDHDNCFRRQFALLTDHPGQGMRAFQRRQDAFEPAKQQKRIQHRLISYIDISCPACVFEV